MLAGVLEDESEAYWNYEAGVLKLVGWHRFRQEYK